jgi:YVTN family beta-propeller protein
LPNSLRGKLLSPIVIVGVLPSGIAVTADGSPAYVTNNFSDPDGVYTTPVVDTSSRTVTATITVGDAPWGVAINPNGEATTYVVNGGIFSQSSGSVIDNAGNNVRKTLRASSVLPGQMPFNLVISPDGSKIYTANQWSNSISLSVNHSVGFG